MPSLQSLILRNQVIESITHIEHLKSLRVLDLSGNKISNLTGIFALQSLQVLRLDDNKLTTLPTALQKLQHLQELGLAHNRISSLSSLRVLSSLTDLSHLSLVGNPLTASIQHWQEYVVFLQPCLAALDAMEVTSDMRAMAVQRFEREELNNLHHHLETAQNEIRGLKEELERANHTTRSMAAQLDRLSAENASLKVGGCCAWSKNLSLCVCVCVCVCVHTKEMPDLDERSERKRKHLFLL